MEHTSTLHVVAVLCSTDASILSHGIGAIGVGVRSGNPVLAQMLVQYACKKDNVNENIHPGIFSILVGWK